MVIATAYTNPEGAGLRTGIEVSGTLTFDKNPYNILDGSAANVDWLSGGQSLRTLVFDFGRPRVITEANWRQSSSTTHGVWRWEVSHDGVTWTPEGANFTLGGTNQFQTTLGANQTAYRYYRLAQQSGTTSNGPFVQEVDFKIDNEAFVTSYGNAGGSGSRAGAVTVISDASHFNGNVQTLVDGAMFANNLYFSPNSTADRQIVFDFGVPRYIDEIRWSQNTISALGDWQWEVSNDATTYSPVGSAFSLGSQATHEFDLTGNAQPYRYWRMRKISGGVTTVPYLREVQFRIDDENYTPPDPGLRRRRQLINA